MAKRKGTIDDGEQLPGMEDEKDEVLIKAAKRYRGLIAERKEVQEREEAAHQKIVDLMHEKGIDQYQYKDLQIFLSKSEKAKVKLTTAAEANGDGE